MDETAEGLPIEPRPEAPGERPPSNEEATTGPGVALLLAVAAVLTAVIGGRAAFMSADASSNWQASIRAQVKQAAAYVEDIRYLYTVETPQAVLTAEAQARAQELTKAVQSTTGLNQSLLAVEQSIEQNLAKTLAPNFPLTADAKYATPGGGYDVGRRLADIRNENPDLVKLDPAHTAAVGDHFAVRSIRLVGCTVLVAGAFLFGSLAQGFRRRRSLFLGAGTTLLVAGVVAAVVVEAVA
jgi:FlaG/FlaF family flagellin (archaellin)